MVLKRGNTMQDPRFRMHPVSVFTLIELLVVIAIISILAALLLPALKEAKKTAHQTSCLSKIRQMKAASFMYASDFNEWFLPIYTYFNKTPPGTGTTTWAEDENTRQYLSLKPYKTVYYAEVPGDMTCEDATYTRSLPNPNGSVNIRSSYGMNYTEFMDPSFPDPWLYAATNYPTFVVYKVSKVKNPSVKMAWADSLSPSIWSAGSSGYVGEQYPSPNDQIAYRHRNGANIAFYDGHGDNLKRNQIDKNNLSTQEIDKLWYAYKN